MREYIRNYIQTCDVCEWDKHRMGKSQGLLRPHPIPDARWESVSMDFITQLPVAASSHDAICVFVDRLNKMVRMAPTTSDVDAVGAARLFIEHIFRHHGMCTTLMTDRGNQFTSRFFRTLMTELDCQQALSTAHHPQTNGQTERMNRILEDTLCHYVGPQ